MYKRDIAARVDVEGIVAGSINRNLARQARANHAWVVDVRFVGDDVGVELMLVYLIEPYIVVSSNVIELLKQVQAASIRRDGIKIELTLQCNIFYVSVQRIDECELAACRGSLLLSKGKPVTIKRDDSVRIVITCY